MARITEVHLNNVRCFAGEQRGETRRITLLVGANGSGKSTFLGCYRTLAYLANLQNPSGNDLDDINYFDSSPFSMGSFTTIARPGKRKFSVGGKFEDHCHGGMKFTFVAGNGTEREPLEQEVQVNWRETEESKRMLRISRKKDGAWQFSGPDIDFEIGRQNISYRQISTWISRVARHAFSPPGREKEEWFVKVANEIRRGFPESAPFVVLPIDPTPGFPRQRYYRDNPIPSLGRDRKKRIDFGKKTGLWDDVQVKESEGGNLLEIKVKTPGGIHNLMDVGYGVYSLLPFADAIFSAEKRATFLLQQPEVHIHPEAQAKLCQWMVESGHEFLIETHSDHVIDRLRICVMKGILRPDDLSIIYFESDSMSTTLHNIQVDEEGNLRGRPSGYRSFFMKEAASLFGFNPNN